MLANCIAALNLEQQNNGKLSDATPPKINI